MISRTPQATILYEDVHVIVLSKPAGLLSQGDISGAPTLVDQMREHVGRPYVGLVHRLDRNTSGLMVLGKRTKSADRLTQAIQGGKLYRHYLAWVKGHFPADTHWPQRWEDKLLKNEASNVVVADAKGRKCVLHARSIFRTESPQFGFVTLMRFDLETGMSHQIRVQSSLRGHPLIGDTKYGGPAFTRVALHSAFLAFPHPMGDQWMEFTSGLPEELRI
jgi:23S rRNA pseudouridine1911/1915/1917 synthase